jgi:tetratricopeptide (TPR) repeat protein
MNCHADHGCSLEQTERLRRSPADDCSSCHMPRGKTDVPHVAFTHHRVGKHAEPPHHEPSGVPDLVPNEESPQLSETDRRRNLGLAYLTASSQSQQPERRTVYLGRSRDLLEAVHQAGLRDGATLHALAKIAGREQNTSRASFFAQEALAADDLSPEARGDALMILATGHVTDGQFAEAVAILEKLTRSRRASEDWRVLGAAYLRLNQPEKAKGAFEKALSINPFDHHSHAGLSEAYRQLGDARRAGEHARKAALLAEHARS